MKIITTIIGFIIVLLGLSFAGLNASPVKINYYFGTQMLSLSLLMVIALAIGAVLGLLVNIIPLIKLKHKNRLYRKQLKNAEQEIANIRSIPIKDSH